MGLEAKTSANYAITTGKRFDAWAMDASWEKSAHNDRLDFAKATQKLHISREQVKTTLLNWLDRSAMERVSVELDADHRNAELTLEQSLRTYPLDVLYEAIRAVTSPAPASELVWLEDFGERVANFAHKATTDLGKRIAQLQSIVGRTNSLRRTLGLGTEGFEYRVARLLVNNLCECGQSSIEGKVYQVLHDKEKVELTDLLSSLQLMKQRRLDTDRTELMQVVAELALKEKERLAAEELSSEKQAGKTTVAPSLNSTKKGVQRCRVLTTTTESKFVNDIVWTELRGLNQAHNPPRETSDVTLIDGGCGVPIIVTTDPGISEDSTMPSIRLEGVCGSLTGSRRGHWRTLPVLLFLTLLRSEGWLRMGFRAGGRERKPGKDEEDRSVGGRPLLCRRNQWKRCVLNNCD